jgi:hypothetical protein
MSVSEVAIATAGYGFESFTSFSQVFFRIQEPGFRLQGWAYFTYV